MRNHPWNAIADYKGRSQSLIACLLAWRRDASRGRGALGTITTAMPIQIKGWKSELRQLGAAECLDLLAIMPSTHHADDVQRRVAGRT